MISSSFKLLSFDIIFHILSFSSTYYKENYKNRNGIFYKQIEDFRKINILNVYAPIKFRNIRERFTYYTTYYYERLLGGKYILYVQDNTDEAHDFDLDDDQLYITYFCRACDNPHLGYGIKNEHQIINI